MSSDTFTTIAPYEWEGDSYYDPLVSASIGGQSRYYAYDGLGSTRQLLDSNQDVTDTYVYEAFGNLMGSSGTTPNPYRYVGSLGYYQAGSSLMHLGARYYMPEVGRFTARDPSWMDNNPYTYVGGAPTDYFDPAGLFRWPGWWPWQPRPKPPSRPITPYLDDPYVPVEPIVMPPDLPEPQQTWGECYANCMSFWVANLVAQCPASPYSFAATAGFAIGCAQACLHDPNSYQ